jgi:hypothetical protein
MKEDSMRRVVVSEFLSLDGVLEAPDQWQLQNDLFTEDMGKDKHEELFTSDGKGKRLFNDEIDETVLKLADTKTFDSGVVALTYKPAG